MEQELFDSLMTSLNEAVQYEKGELELKTTVVEVSGDEIEFYGAYAKLSEKYKLIAMDIVNDLLRIPS